MFRKYGAKVHSEGFNLTAVVGVVIVMRMSIIQVSHHSFPCVYIQHPIVP